LRDYYFKIEEADRIFDSEAKR